MAKRAATRPKLRPWPADKVERWPLDRIIPYERNPRLHTEQQVDHIASLMTRFGVTTPVLVDEDGVLIYGHGRRMAAEKLGFKTFPVVVARGWTDDEKRAYRIADNQSALTSRWDDELLRVEFQSLQQSEFDVGLLGFEPGQLTSLELVDAVEEGATDPWAEWGGMPSFEEIGGKPFHVVRVFFRDQAGVDAFAAKLGLTIAAGSKFMWYPSEAKTITVSSDEKFTTAAAE